MDGVYGGVGVGGGGSMESSIFVEKLFRMSIC